MTTRMAPQASRSRGRPLSSVILHGVLTGFAILLLWTGISLNLLREYQLAEHGAIEDSQNLGRAFSENILRTIEAVDQQLLFLRDAYTRDPATFNLFSWARQHKVLNDIAVQSSMVGPDGIVLQSDLGPTTSRIDLSDRAHFRVHVNSKDDQLFISEPVIGRVSGKWSIQFSRGFKAPDGSFGGVLVVSLDPYYLSRFYDSLSIGNGTIALTNLKGVILARAPITERSIGMRLPGDLVDTETRGHWNKIIRHQSPIDGVPRLVSYTRVDRFPLIVGIGLAESDVFAAYQRNRVLYVAVGGVVTLAILAVGVITTRQARRLQASRQALTATLENISQGILMIDPADHIPVINGRAFELLGLPDEFRSVRLTGNDLLTWQHGTHEFGPPESWTPEMRDVLNTGALGVRGMSYERTRPNGTVLEVRTQKLPDGGAVRTYTDITERKRTEAALASARDAAEAASRARSEFLAVISHEIRTPMNGIIGVAGLLRDMNLDDTARHYVNIVRESADHLLQLINDVLDFSKLEAGKLEIETLAFDLYSTVSGAIDLLKPQATRKGLALELKIAPSVPRMVIGDPGRFRQVLLNLVGNAVKFTDKGFIHVSLEGESLSTGETYVSCSISDTGIGIPSDKLGALFERFSQVDSSVSRRFGGTGLGLAICRKLIEQMGGGIGVDSQSGLGSTFHFHIPMQPAPDAPPEPHDTGSDAADGPRYRVLVAEDNNTNKLIITHMLERNGHRVESVANGQEAVEAVRDIPYDLVLMDLMMPEMDGLTATRAIRGLSGDAGSVTIIGLTASARAEDRDACYAAGMNGFLSKPVTARKLTETVAQVMGARGDQRPVDAGTA